MRNDWWPSRRSTLRPVRPSARFDELTETALEAKLDRAADAFGRYRRSPMAQRAVVLDRAAGILEAEQEPLGRLMATEMGKLSRSGREEALKCAAGCRFYAERGASMLADAPIATGPPESFVRYQPLGVVLAVMPWNFPFWQVFRLAAPALMAGNAVLLKHASNVPQCALRIEDDPAAGRPSRRRLPDAARRRDAGAPAGGRSARRRRLADRQ